MENRISTRKKLSAFQNDLQMEQRFLLRCYINVWCHKIAYVPYITDVTASQVSFYKRNLLYEQSFHLPTVPFYPLYKQRLLAAWNRESFIHAFSYNLHNSSKKMVCTTSCKGVVLCNVLKRI